MRIASDDGSGDGRQSSRMRLASDDGSEAAIENDADIPEEVKIDNEEEERKIE